MAATSVPCASQVAGFGNLPGGAAARAHPNGRLPVARRPPPTVRAAPNKKPPAASCRGLPSQPAWIRRSGQEVSLDAEQDADDVLVLDGVDAARPRAVGGESRRTAEGRIQLGIENVQADIEVRMRVPLG